jgi:predicted metal-dependent HD superfamily phosphohydrolase
MQRINENEMRKRWDEVALKVIGQATKEIEDPDDWSNRCWKILKFGYCAENRHYHCFNHIDSSLHKMGFVISKLKNPLAVELAIWFHDVIYNPLSRNSEDDSANLAYGLLKDLNPQLALKVWDLVMFTKWDSEYFVMDDIKEIAKITEDDEGLNNLFSKVTTDFLYLRDIDWSGFGSEWNTYRETTYDIFDESPYIDSDEFDSKRIGFLEYILGMKRSIFSTEFFTETCEAQAFVNINRELALLKNYKKNNKTS